MAIRKKELTQSEIVRAEQEFAKALKHELERAVAVCDRLNVASVQVFRKQLGLKMKDGRMITLDVELHP